MSYLNQILNISGHFLIIAGFVFAYIAQLGITKFNNQYINLHIIGMHDMLAIPLILIGLSMLFMHNKMWHEGIKVVILTVMLYIVNPISSYVLVKIFHFIKDIPLDDLKGDEK